VITTSKKKRHCKNVSPLLGTYFSSSSLFCQKVERAQARIALNSVLQQTNLGTVWEACTPHGECIGILLAEPKDWETTYFGCQVIQISLFVKEKKHEQRQQIAAKLLKQWLRTRPTKKQEYIVVRIPAEDVALIHALEEHGFYMLVPMVTLERNKVCSKNIVINNHKFELSPIQPQDILILAEIARYAFVYGRFWIEPLLSKDISGEMHATWFRNCCNKSLADEVIVARIANQPVGFIAIRCRRYDDVQVGEINLIAVSPSVRHIGIGHALVKAGCQWAENRTDNIIVRTELPNTFAIQIYEKNGFQIGEGSLYYRLWRP
jgi:GNAT superfamily N-acetyltransferase